MRPSGPSARRWAEDVGRSSAATSGFRVKPAHQKDNQADQQNQAEPAAADGRTANIKTAAAEQEKKNNDKKEYIHEYKVSFRLGFHYGALTSLPCALRALWLKSIGKRDRPIRLERWVLNVGC
jgi:hypothetical protein